ncbi:hypothetical protein [Actinoallomurus soli]|uniref:hypothetical protein n=1 Tax=Actinoallomurus soli TaxID=2952535 RepID=UPI002092AF15|nr:hypothetical protein [Actinoallomurus soli]MCO5968226.1 hypothetical protein [Actinoallomurus soli]
MQFPWGVPMRRPVDGEVYVHYGQLYVVSGAEQPELDDAFAGQTSGLCGAAVPGFLWLITGLHTGEVGFTVEIHEHAPELDPAWTDVVEVSFRPQASRTFLELWGGQDAWDLDLAPIDYRVRYCARGMDEGNALDTRVKGPQADRYLLQFWAAPPGPDRIVRQTSEIAAYWHRFARALPPPPTAAERAGAERQARAERKRADHERRREAERYAWGGRLPTDALRAVPSALGLMRYDADLVHALDAAGPGVQRRVAAFAARSAATAAGLADLDWVAPALAALEGGRALPSPFDDWDRMFRSLSADPNVPNRMVGEAKPAPGRQRGLGVETAVVSSVKSPPKRRRISQPHMALPAVFHAGRPNALEAAIGAVSAAAHTYGEDYPAFLREVRQVCASPSHGDASGEDPDDVPVPVQGSDESGVLPAPVVPEAVDGLLDTELIDGVTVRIPAHHAMTVGCVVQVEWVVDRSTTVRWDPISQPETPMEFTFDVQDAYAAAYRGGVEISYTLFRDEDTVIARSKTLSLSVR